MVVKQPAPYLLVPSHKSFLWPIFTEAQPDGSPPGTRLRRTLVNSQPHLNCLVVFDGILFSQKLSLLPPALSHATWCGKQQARIFPACPASPHSLFPPISAITLFLFLLSPWRGSKQAASCSSSLRSSITEEMQGLEYRILL